MEERQEKLRFGELTSSISNDQKKVGQVEYLGHIISGEGVRTDPKKVEAMVNWPKPMNLKALRGFLSLTGYYRQFVKGYGIISRPLTNLLKKGNFKCDEEAEAAFEKLKEAVSTVPALGLLDFNEPFILETDACGVSVRAVLMQKGRPLAFLSQALSARHLGLSIYEKEFLAVLMAVERWRHYLEGGKFIIKTDHESLQFLLQHKLQTQLQKRGMTQVGKGKYSCRCIIKVSREKQCGNHY